MSLAAHVWVTRVAPELSGAELRVLLVLAEYHDAKDGRCDPSVATIAARCGRSERYVQLALHRLKERGLLDRDARGGRAHPTRYLLPVAVPSASSPNGTAERVHIGATLSPDKGCTIPAQKGEQFGPERVHTGATRTVGEPRENRRGATPPLPPQEPAAPRKGELFEALESLCGEPATRSERGSYHRALKELREAGATPEEVAGRAEVYRRRWPNVSLTPSALARHWGALGRPEAPPGGRPRRAGGGGGESALEVQARLGRVLREAAVAAPPAPAALPAPRGEVA